MGAYENPRFFNAPNYMAGTQAFIGTFKKGLEEGLQYGEDLIADRKEYEKGIYEKGDELKKELDAAVANSQMTKQQVQGALRQFYDEALAIDVPTKKGLGGLFVKAQEKRLGDLDLQEAQQSFTDAVTGINTAFNYTYDPEVDIMENEDRGHEYYKKKRAIYEAIKSGNAKTDFSYAKGQGFNSNIKVMIDGEEKEFTTAEIQTIFTASGKEQRDIIDAKHTETVDGLYKRVEAATSNRFEAVKLGDKDALVKMETDADRITDQVLGLKRDQDGKILFNKKNIDFINDEYNNHADISLENKIEIFRKNSAFANLSNDQLEDVINEAMTIGVDAYKDKYAGGDEVKAREFYNNVLNAKAEIVKESYMEELRDRGLLDKGYKAPTVNDINTTTDYQRKQSKILNYADIRAANLAQLSNDAITMTMAKGVDVEDQMSIPDKSVFSDPDNENVRTFMNPDFKEGDPESTRTVRGLIVNPEFQQNFIGKILKINNKGDLRRITGAFIDEESNIKFTYEEGDVSLKETIDGVETVTKADLDKTINVYNLKNPQSMKSLYKAMLSDLKGEDANVTADVAYAELVSRNYLNRPEQFKSTDMNQWAEYIVDNYPEQQIKSNKTFMTWLQNNSALLPSEHPFKKIAITYN